MSKWHNISSQEVLEQLAANTDVGLDEQSVKLRREKHGLNEYSQSKQDSIVVMVLRQLKDFANIILILAGFLSLMLADRKSVV